MVQQNKCRKCGDPLPSDAPAAVCPKCLMKVGLDGYASDSDIERTVISDSAVNAGDSNEAQADPTEPLTLASGALPLTDSKIRYFGEYELIEELARGGMGVVYKARQTRLNRIIALKMILAGQFASPTDVERFHTEAEAVAQLDHPGIVPIFEIGEHDGHHFFSMALVEGKSLADRIIDGPFSPEDAAALTKFVAEAISFAHGKGVIHRDLKPANILIDRDGHPRVTDFGLAKQTEGKSDLTATGQILGTPSYMSPEQAGGRTGEVSEASDVYSIGAILYAMLTGRPPFVADQPLEVIKSVIHNEPDPPRMFNSGLPRDLEMICLKCLQKRPSDRYESAQDLADDLERFQNGEPVHARPLPMLIRSLRWSDRNIGRFTAGAIVVTLLLPILINAWFAYLFGRWTWTLVGVSYGLMLLLSAPYLFIMLITSVRAKHRLRSGQHLKNRNPISKPMLGAGSMLIAVAVGGYIYVLAQYGWAVPKNARFLPLLAIVGAGLIIRGLGIRR